MAGVSPPERPPGVARRRLLKFARVVAAGLALTVALLAIAHLRPVRARAAALGVRLLHDRYRIDARIERLDYNLFVLHGSVSGIEIAASARPAEPFFRADRVAIDLGWRSVFGTIRIDELQFVNPRVRLATDAQGRLNLPPALRQRGAIGPGTRLDVRRVAISGLAIALAKMADEIDLNITDVSLSLVSTRGVLTGDLRAARPGLLRIAGRTATITRLDARLSFDGTALRADPVNLSSPGGTLALRGAIGPFTENAPIQGSLTAQLDVSQLVQQPGRTTLRGAIALAGTISGTIAAPQAALHVSAPGVSYASLSPALINADLKVTREALTVDRFGISAPWARLQAQGRVGLTPAASSELRATWTGADAGTLAQALRPMTVRVRTLVGGDARASWTGLNPDGLTARLVTRARPAPGVGLPVEGTATLSIEKGAWSLIHAHRAADAIVVQGRNRGTLDVRSLGKSTLGGDARIDIASARDALAGLRRAGLALPAALGDAVDGQLAVMATAGGRLESPRLAAVIEGREWRYGSVTGVSAEGAFSADASGLEVPRFAVRLPAGLLEGSRLSVSRAGDLRGEATFTGTNIRPLLADAPPWARVTSGGVAVRGTLAGTLGAPVVDGSLTAERLAAAGQQIDRLRADFSGAPSRIALQRLEAFQGAGRLAAEGSFDAHTRAYRLQAEGRGLSLRPCEAAVADCPGALPLAATMDVTIDAAGLIDQPSGNVSFEVRNARWDRYAPGVIEGRASVVNGTAVVGARLPSLAVQLDAIATLQSPTLMLVARGDRTPVAAALTAAGFTSWAARVHGAISPTATLTIPAGGTREASYTLDLPPTDLAIDAIELHLPETARLELSPQSLRVNHLAVLWGSSRFTAAGSLTDTAPGTLDATLDADVLDVLALGRAAGVDGAFVDAGRIRANVVAAGTLATPVVSGDVVVQDAAGTLAGRRVSGANARLALKNGWIELSQLSAAADGLALSARGRAPAAWISEVAPAVPRSWVPPAAGATATLAGELSGTPSPLLRSFLPPDTVGDSELGATFELEAAGPRLSAVRGDVTVAHAALAVGASRLALAAPARLVIEGHRASLDAWRLTGEGTDLRVTGEVALDAEAPTFHVEAAGALNIAAARAFTGAPVGGTLDVQLRADGTFDAPRLQGTLDLREGIVSAPKLHVAATDVAGHARFEGDRVVIDRLAGMVNGSPVSASGDVAMFSAADRAHVLRLSTTRLPLQLLGGARAEIDADLTLTAGAGVRRLSGRVEVTPEPFRGSVAVIKQLIALQRAGRIGPQQPVAPAGPPLQFDVAVATRENLIVDSSFGRVELAADLRLIGTLEQPLLNGQATLLSDGVLRAGGKTYRVVRGTIDFTNPRRIEPSVDIIAETQISDYRIRMILTGPTESLQTSLSSDPPLPEADLRSLLVTGRLPDDRADRGKVVGEQEVVQALSGDLFGIAASAIGLDSVSVGTPDLDLISGNIDATTALNIRKAVSRQVELIISQDLQEDTFSWMFIYKPTRALQVRLLSRDTNDGALEFRHELRLARPRSTATMQSRQGAPAKQDAARRIRPRVTAVTFAGSPGVSNAELLGELTLRPGKHFDAWTWRREADRLEEFYRLHGRFSAQVRPRRTITADGAGVALEYEIERGPATVLRVSGYDFSGDAVQTMRRAWSETLSTPFLLEDLERAARAQLVADGYIQARVTSSLPRSDDSVMTVLLDVIPGPRSRVRTIEFSGNLALPSSRLRAAVDDAGIEQGTWENGEALVVLVGQLYKALGYLDVGVQIGVPAFADGEARLPVRISEGRQYALARIDVSGARLRETADVRAAAGVPDGAPFVVTLTDTVQKNIQGSYLKQAFDDVDVRVAPAFDREHGSVVLAVTVDEGRRRVIDGVRIEGTDRTRPKVVSDAVKLRKGMPLGPGEVSAAQKRVYDTGAFSTVEITREPSGAPAAREGDEPVVATVRVREAPRFLVRYGVQLNRRLDATSTENVYSVGAGVDVRDRSLLGRAISAGGGVQFDTVSQSARALLGTPTTFGTAVRSNLFASVTHEREEQTAEYELFDTEASFTAEQRLRVRRHVEASWAFAYDYRKLKLASVPRVDLALSAEGWTAGPRTGIVWDTRDDPFNATRGFFHSSGLDLGIRALGSEIDYSRYLLQQFVFLPAGRVVFASGLRFGTLHTYGQENLLSLDVRFKAGGSRTVRGYAEDSLSAETFLGVPLGGTQLLVLNQEIRFPIYKWFKGVGFVDAGGTYASLSDIGALRVGTGFGLRLATPFALVRVDLAYPVDPRPEDKPRVYFSIGQAF